MTKKFIILVPEHHFLMFDKIMKLRGAVWLTDLWLKLIAFSKIFLHFISNGNVACATKLFTVESNAVDNDRHFYISLIFSGNACNLRWETAARCPPPTQVYLIGHSNIEKCTHKYFSHFYCILFLINILAILAYVKRN